MSRTTQFVVILGAALAGGGTPLTRPPVVTAGATFACTPTHAWGGDGPIWCAEGPRVRLAGIAAREASAETARDHLVELISGKGTGGAYARTSDGHILVSGPTLDCTSAGSAGDRRTAAWCKSPIHGDLSCAMVRSGYAQRWDRYWRGHSC